MATARSEELINAIRSEITKTPAAAIAEVPEVKPADVEVDPIFGVSIDKRAMMPAFKPEDWDERVRGRIPKPTNYAFNPTTLERFLFALKMGGPILLHGPTGTGKTSLAQEVAARLCIPFYRKSCHRDMESAELLGHIGVVNEGGVPVTKHIDTDVTLAFKYGGMPVIDEAFRTSALMSIQSAFEQPPSLVLEDHHGVQRALTPDKPLFMVLTDNTNGTGDSTGKYIAQVQDLSTLDRVSHAIYLDYMTPAEELAMLDTVFGKKDAKDKTMRGMMIKVTNLVRVAFKEGKIMQTMSIRALLNWYRYNEVLEHPAASFTRAYWDKLGPDCKVIANNCFRQVFGKDVS